MSSLASDRSAQVVVTEQRGGVLEIALNRPRYRNAVTREMARGIADALDALDADGELRVAILTGAGGCFSSGMDLSALVRGESAWIADRGFAGLSKRPPRKPLIAAVEGFAVAGGFEIALACDLIVMARDAYLALPEVQRSLVPVGGGIVRLAERLPESVARELVLTGNPLSAARAAELGLANEVTALGGARSLAARIAANAPLAVVAAKLVFEQRGTWSPDELWSRQETIGSTLEASADAREGSLAFLEKRRPKWTGR